MDASRPSELNGSLWAPLGATRPGRVIWSNSSLRLRGSAVAMQLGSEWMWSPIPPKDQLMDGWILTKPPWFWLEKGRSFQLFWIFGVHVSFRGKNGWWIRDGGK